MPVELTKNFKRVRRFSPKKCSPGSFRTVKAAKGKRLVVCCPKRYFKKGRCRIGTRVQSILIPRKRK